MRHGCRTYALYSAIKNAFGGKSLSDWEDDIRLRRPAVMEAYQAKLEDEVRFYEFQQYLFRQQWSALKQYANEKGIQMIGDVPIYVASDSADAWAHPELFQLDEHGRPSAVAGCPPDGFSATGQLWGNPLYRWDYHKKTGYQWWLERLAACFELYDIVRIIISAALTSTLRSRTAIRRRQTASGCRGRAWIS